MEVSRNEFQQNLWKRLRVSSKRPYMVSCEVGFVMDNYGWKSQLLNSVSDRLLYRILRKFPTV
jgi:hypothetical protein